jgi:hypothetical protein
MVKKYLTAQAVMLVVCLVVVSFSPGLGLAKSNNGKSGTSGGGEGVGTGEAGQVAVWQGDNLLGGSVALIWDEAKRRLGVGIDESFATSEAMLEVFNYSREVGRSRIFGIRGRAYSNDPNADTYGGFFQSSSDSSVKNSYGVFGRSNPENWSGESVGVYGEGYDVGVKGVGDIGVLADSPYGGVALHTRTGRVILEGPVQIGTPAKRQGITLYDRTTGNPFCLEISSGSLLAVSGICN